jgi:hypothetical protein
VITIKQHLELVGEHVKLTTDGDAVLVFEVCGHPLTHISAESKVKHARDFIDKLTAELTQVKARLDDLVEGRAVKQLTFEPADLATIFESIEALSSNDARELAYKRFYADKANASVVLIVKSCERTGDLPEGKHTYKVAGFTRPRQKRLKRTLAPVEEKKVTER